jgi:predicted DNA-binding transcriptional regulator AlpA
MTLSKRCLTPIAGLDGSQRILINMYEVANLTGLAPETQIAMEKKGLLPKSTQVTPRLRLYVKSQIDDWIATKLADVEAAG